VKPNKYPLLLFPLSRASFFILIMRWFSYCIFSSPQRLLSLCNPQINAQKKIFGQMKKSAQTETYFVAKTNKGAEKLKKRWTGWYCS
jgi:hypothetical protein